MGVQKHHMSATTNYGRPNSYPKPKYVDFPLRCLKCQPYVEIMVDSWKIMELGTNNDKMCAEISTENTPNTPQFIWPICPNLPIIWDTFEKIPLHMSIFHAHVYSQAPIISTVLINVTGLIFEIVRYVYLKSKGKFSVFQFFT